MSKLSTFSSKLAEEEPLYLEIPDIKRENDTNESSKTLSFESISPPPEIKEEKPKTSPPKNTLHYQAIQERVENHENQDFTEVILPEEEEKINFKSFQILKIIGAGAFGKIFLVCLFFSCFSIKNFR